MPLMKHLQNRRVGTLSGHVIFFESNTPKQVPADAVQDCLAAGAAFVDENDRVISEEESAIRFMLTGDARASVIYLAVEALVKEGDLKNFDAGNAPKSAAVGDRLGFPVSPTEVRDTYQKFLQCRSEGVLPELHPSAKAVVNIAEAKSRSDLLLIASELGINEETAKALSAKELRVQLMKRAAGNVIDESV